MSNSNDTDNKQEEKAYKGQTLYNNPHGQGVLKLKDGSVYKGSFKYGEMDGFGEFSYPNYGKYTGFMSVNKPHGIGTYEDEKIITKGTWRKGKKHGLFTYTNKVTNVTFRQLWRMGVLEVSKKTQYIVPEQLQTLFINPKSKPKKKYNLFKGTFNECKSCYENPACATNTDCGHVIFCYDCLSKCDKCPICRVNIGDVLKLYIS